MLDLLMVSIGCKLVVDLGLGKISVLGAMVDIRITWSNGIIKDAKVGLRIYLCSECTLASDAKKHMMFKIDLWKEDKKMKNLTMRTHCDGDLTIEVEEDKKKKNILYKNYIHRYMNFIINLFPNKISSLLA